MRKIVSLTLLALSCTTTAFAEDLPSVEDALKDARAKSAAMPSLAARPVPASRIPTTLKVTIPAHHLLAAARKIRPQTGPAYKVHGTLCCLSAMNEWAPGYPVKNVCQLTVAGRTVVVKEPEAIIEVLKKSIYQTSPYYSVEGKVLLEARSNEFPPYGGWEKAVLTVEPRRPGR